MSDLSPSWMAYERNALDWVLTNLKHGTIYRVCHVKESPVFKWNTEYTARQYSRWIIEHWIKNKEGFTRPTPKTFQFDIYEVKLWRKHKRRLLIITI